MPLTRREFLKTGTVAAAATSFLPSLLREGTAWAETGLKTRRVILVAFAGGVRSRETIGTPQNIPNLMKIARAGVVCPNMKARNIGHYGAALGLFTGCFDEMGIRENQRGRQPTVFEYVRKQLGLPAKEVWLSTSGGAQTLNYAYGEHKDYGAQYGANLISGDGIFNAEFRDILDRFGRPKKEKDAEAALVEKLEKSMDPEEVSRIADGSLRNDRETHQKVKNFILDEISAGTSNITGPGAEDAKSIRTAMNLFRIFKPRMMGIGLQNADVAHNSFNAYTEVIRRNDEEVGKLWDAIQADPELRATTTILVLPEFGRDKDLNQRNGLDHGDRSDELGKVAMFAAGPDFKKGSQSLAEFQTIDVAPTLCALMGAKAEHSKAKSLKELYG
ncbi:MAG: twin-arginine translocation signal domain-containing protein [Candidatus Brocadiae bacterium]|nr:twin-arginine translocation signal domain-containing protein [Candidatus Brocadiia bacterium]